MNWCTQRFISKGTDKSLPFFKILKQGKKFQWTEKCKAAFQALKKHLGKASFLLKPKPRESLLWYLVVSAETISAVLVKVEKTCQLPVYYISKALLSTEASYPNMEKLDFSLVIVSIKLRLYCQAHSIEFLTIFSLKQVLQKTNASGCLLK